MATNVKQRSATSRARTRDGAPARRRSMGGCTGLFLLNSEWGEADSITRLAERNIGNSQTSLNFGSSMLTIPTPNSVFVDGSAGRARTSFHWMLPRNDQ